MSTKTTANLACEIQSITAQLTSEQYQRLLCSLGLQKRMEERMFFHCFESKHKNNLFCDKGVVLYMHESTTHNEGILGHRISTIALQAREISVDDTLYHTQFIDKEQWDTLKKQGRLGWGDITRRLHGLFHPGIEMAIEYLGYIQVERTSLVLRETHAKGYINNLTFVFNNKDKKREIDIHFTITNNNNGKRYVQQMLDGHNLGNLKDTQCKEYFFRFVDLALT